MIREKMGELKKMWEEKQVTFRQYITYKEYLERVMRETKRKVQKDEEQEEE